MLKKIDARLNADVLHALALMGHVDVVVVACKNFPAASTAAQTGYGKLLRMDNLSSVEAVDAILSVMPLEAPGDRAVCRMNVDDDPEHLPPVQVEVLETIRSVEDPKHELSGLARQEFYASARNAYAVVQTGERRFYGTILLRKGAIAPEF